MYFTQSEPYMETEIKPKGKQESHSGRLEFARDKALKFTNPEILKYSLDHCKCESTKYCT